MLKDVTFGIDINKNAIVVSENESIKAEIYHLLMSRPGDDVYNLKKGVDIMKYQFQFDDKKTEIENILMSQIREYTDHVPLAVEIIFVSEKASLSIKLATDSGIYIAMIEESVDKKSISVLIERGGNI